MYTVVPSVVYTEEAAPVAVVVAVNSLVLNTKWIMWLLLVIPSGRDDPHFCSIKVVPSPSMMLRWSQSQVYSQRSMLKALKRKMMIMPSSTLIDWICSWFLVYMSGKFGEKMYPGEKRFLSVHQFVCLNLLCVIQNPMTIVLSIAKHMKPKFHPHKILSIHLLIAHLQFRSLLLCKCLRLLAARFRLWYER